MSEWVNYKTIDKWNKVMIFFKKKLSNIYELIDCYFDVSFENPSISFINLEMTDVRSV